MAVPFHGIFLSREASLLIPTGIFDSVALSNLTVDHLLMDRSGIQEDTGVTIIPDNDNLSYSTEGLWHPHTELNADFNNTLDGGTLSSRLGIRINGVVIRRTSNRSNFTEWEDVVVFPMDSEAMGTFNGAYEDIFVESGVVYRYTVQTVTDGIRGPVLTTTPSILDYSYSWLIGEDEKQVMFAYNPKITNYVTVVKDNLTETIGSKYPYITRNANVGYRQFQFSASITQMMDVEHSLLSNDNIFLVPADNPASNVEYNTFYTENNMDIQNNYVIEREFRKKLEEFLYDGKPKVFKSDTEGLFLVRLTNVSLDPKNELGRTIYDMSCTMTEIAKIDFETLIDHRLKKGVKVSELE